MNTPKRPLLCALVGLAAGAYAAEGSDSWVSLTSQVADDQANYVGDYLPSYQNTYYLTNNIAGLMRDLKQMQVLSDAPHLTLSGVAGVQGVVAGNKSYTSDLDFNTFEIDGLVQVNDWVSAYFSLDTNSDDSDSIYVKRGIVTIGDLTRSPWVASFGKMYAPFGRNYTNGVEDALTAVEMDTRAALVSYDRDGWAVDAYVFANDLERADHHKHVNNYGFNVMHHGQVKDIDTDLSVAFLSDISAANSIQPALIGGNTITKFVPGVSSHAYLSSGQYTLRAEYVTALRHFDAAELASAPRVSSLHTEAEMAVPYYHDSMKLSASLDKSFQTADLNLPKTSVYATARADVLPRTEVALEARRNMFPESVSADSENRFLSSIKVYF